MCVGVFPDVERFGVKDSISHKAFRLKMCMFDNGTRLIDLIELNTFK